MEALALDFDGVISDSGVEAFVVALRTYVARSPVDRWVEPLRAIEDLDRSRIAADPLYAEFVDLMPLGNRAEDFGVALRILEEGLQVPTQADYDRVRDGLGVAFLDDFHARFYRERTELRVASPRAWVALLGPYPEFVAVLRRRFKDTRLAIATAKDRASVTPLLDAYGVSDLFPPDFVLDKETGPDKRAHLRELSSRLGVPLAEITFIDDKVNHLEKVATLGVRCGLAAWGYNGPREREIARDRGFEVFELQDVERALFGDSAHRVPGGASDAQS